MSESKPFSGDTVVVIGMGYVGCVTAACLAHLGHSVIGVDPDAHKVDAVNQGKSPFYEPGLDTIIQASVAAGRLRASQELGPALQQSNITLI